MRVARFKLPGKVSEFWWFKALDLKGLGKFKDYRHRGFGF